MRKSFILQFFTKSMLLLTITLISANSLFSQTIHQNAKDGSLIFKLKDSYVHNYTIDENNFVDLSSMTNLSKLIEKYQVTSISRELTAFNDPKCMRIFFVNFSAIQQVDEFITALSKLDFVEYAELDYKRKVMSVPTNDPYYAGNYKWYLTQIKAEDAWAIQQGSSSVKVAIVDNAVWGAHPDLNISATNQCNATVNPVQVGAGKSAPPTSVAQSPNCDETDLTTPNGCLAYEWSHGTHCAGLVGAINNNSIGISSIAGGVTLIGVRCADNSGPNDMYSTSITRGINWAAQQGVNVISMSLGGTTSSTSEQTQMTTLFNQGICLVAAAGNDGDGANEVNYPAGYTNVLSVASTDNNKKLSTFSEHGSWVKVAAPGGYYNSSTSYINMTSTTYCTSQYYRIVGVTAITGNYDGMQGTSMACPVTAGACALLKSKNSSATPTQIYNCLVSTSQTLTSGSNTIASGSGIIDVAAALGCIGGSSTTPTAQFSATPTSGTAPLSVQFTDQSTPGTGATITQRAWTFTGGNPASSSAQNPSVTYSVPGTYNVSLTITNSASATDNETKTGYIVVSQAGSNFTLDFESSANFTTSFSPWTTNDVDLSPTYGIDGVTFTGSGEAMAYMAFNPSATTPATTGADAHAGVRQGACFAASTPPNNDWLISPQIRPLNASWKFRVWVRSYTAQYGLEKYKIGVSTSGNQPANFTTFLTGATALEAPITWTLKEFALTSYVNQDIYFGINCVSNDAFIFFIDDISIGAASGIDESQTDNSIHVYPNPAQDVIFINFEDASRRKSQINITDMSGKIIMSQEYNETGTGGVAIDASNIPSGMYMIRFIFDDKIVVKKLSIAR